MKNFYRTYCLCLLSFIASSVLEKTHGQLSNNKDELLNWCLDSQNHKPKPGKEDYLHKQCSPWKDHACCTEETAANIHHTDMYNFTFDHCANETGQNMSEKCRRHFNQDNCFYECEPHIGFWVVKTTRKIASERYFKVPLCASDCHSWFEACKDDYTCAQNWPRDFKFSKGRNICREGSQCRTFDETYKSAENFCESVWDHSWSYTPDSQPCIHIWFNGGKENPNRQVAEYYINKRFGGTASRLPILSLFSQLVIASVLFLM